MQKSQHFGAINQYFFVVRRSFKRRTAKARGVEGLVLLGLRPDQEIKGGHEHLSAADARPQPVFSVFALKSQKRGYSGT
jgi:hypothetical protein